MLLAWIADLDAATRTDNLAPMSPLGCVGFLVAAIGAWSLPAERRAATTCGMAAAVLGLLGLVDVAFFDGFRFNRSAFGVDTRISSITAGTLVLLGVAITLEGRNWTLARRLALLSGAIGGAGAIGFLLGVPLFYGAGRQIQMSWQAALCWLLLAFAIVWSHPGSWFFDRGLAGHFARRTLAAVFAIPVLSGILATSAARAEWWSFNVAAWVITLAAVVGLGLVVAIAAERLAGDDKRLTELAIRDPLTGAYNRRYFLAEAEKAANRARRYQETAVIAVVDLDNFKEINDEWGHAAGDEALVRVNRALRSRLRSSDVLGRVGGDEFAALILHVTAVQALHVVDEMRAAVAIVSEELRAEGRRNRLGASIGFATLDDEADVEALLELADRRMYDDKRLHEIERSANH